MEIISIFNDFYICLNESETSFNFDKFPLFCNNAVTVSTVDNYLKCLNNGKQFPCLVFNI